MPTDASTALLTSQQAGSATVDEVFAAVHSSSAGLTTEQALDRLKSHGPNAVRTHRVSAVEVLASQLRSAVLILLAVTAVLSFFLGDPTQAVIIGVILLVSIGLSFTNEYRAARATAQLHSQVKHFVLVRRDGQFVRHNVTDLVPGDVIRLALGEVVPADVRLVSVNALECDESILSGESAPAHKSAERIESAEGLPDYTDLAFMGSIVTAGSAAAVVYATGGHTQFGRLAAGLGDRHPETEFQKGLRQFSYLLLRVALILTAFILVINVMLGRPLIDSALFALAIAVGITPQLLPAVVSTSLATGSRRLATLRVLVKRLVCIEDLGDIDTLITDKTGTLTNGRIDFVDALDAVGRHSDTVMRRGLLASDVDTAGGQSANALDGALAEAAAGVVSVDDVVKRSVRPFDHVRCASSVVVDDVDGQLLIVKGAPEQVLSRCRTVQEAARHLLDELFAQGRRVVAVASKPAPGRSGITDDDEDGLTLDGFLCFADEPKAAAARSLRDLQELGIEVKVATGDNPRVAEKVCAELGLPSKGTITGSQLDALDRADYAKAVSEHTVFARISPEQKAALIIETRRAGRSVGFLGDGVNDALALHAADVGISVDTATDVAKDAADVVLMEKDLGVLAAGVAEGRRIFANTIKYVLMGTSSNFGNMFSAAAASSVLPFLPMLPSQILLNNLLYDTSQLAIPSDRVDGELLRAPSHWNIAFVRRFMLTFGPVSSLFDFLTFGLLIGVLHAAPEEFRTGWFVESLATQTLIIFAIRTRRIPFSRSRPGALLTAATLAVVTVGICLTYWPPARRIGLIPLPWQYFVALGGLAAVYLVVVEITKSVFYRESVGVVPPMREGGADRRIHRRAARFSHAGRLGDTQYADESRTKGHIEPAVDALASKATSDSQREGRS
ncbi:magnesium-translocating P-type ATPase [Arthrobacter sp. SLBN-53]|uniref:magnesium-translocating P-type ATPase n=1 Tax=Arthrobacter sp. SLBN-53 TaxID=2768412 RepID=UPI00115337B7|nr:magnesium-translocating P-type ATPase [Arthrobacter sp. SLBN-53]TQK30762.1 Mg2+-importing ATPase [Arthrobacter sp. SLBN-53]